MLNLLKVLVKWKCVVVTFYVILDTYTCIFIILILKLFNYKWYLRALTTDFNCKNPAWGICDTSFCGCVDTVDHYLNISLII